MVFRVRCVGKNKQWTGTNPDQKHQQPQARLRVSQQKVKLILELEEDLKGVFFYVCIDNLNKLFNSRCCYQQTALWYKSHTFVLPSYSFNISNTCCPFLKLWFLNWYWDWSWKTVHDFGKCSSLPERHFLMPTFSHLFCGESTFLQMKKPLAIRKRVKVNLVVFKSMEEPSWVIDEYGSIWKWDQMIKTPQQNRYSQSNQYCNQSNNTKEGASTVSGGRGVQVWTTVRSHCWAHLDRMMI